MVKYSREQWKVIKARDNKWKARVKKWGGKPLKIERWNGKKYKFAKKDGLMYCEVDGLVRTKNGTKIIDYGVKGVRMSKAELFKKLKKGGFRSKKLVYGKYHKW